MSTSTNATGSRNATLDRRKGAWTREEDLLLKKCVEKYGEGNWQKVPLRAGLSRCRKSCRLRWLNYLKPGIKRDEFDVYEIDLILRLHRLLGNRWALIAGRIPGRTANDIKNYWNSHLSKRIDPKTCIITDHRGMKLGNNRKRRNAGNLMMAVDKQKKIKRPTVNKTKRKDKMVEENGAASVVLQANNGDETTVVKPRPITIRPNLHIPKGMRSPRREHSKASSCQMVLKTGSITLDPNLTNNANSEASPSNAKEGSMSHSNSSNEDSWLLSTLFGPEEESLDGGDISFSLSPPLITHDDHVQEVGNRQLELQDLDLDHEVLWKFVSNWNT